MADFHFLRPWWLLALPAGIALILALARGRTSGGAWRRVVDAALQPFVLSGPAAFGERRWPLAAALAAWVLAALALAGPAWERVPVPAFRSNEALVVALDLSRSMDAADLSPSRLARARLKLLELLDRRKGGQMGLVVFSANAFTVTPLTTDTHTISALVSSLTTDIMPSQGSDVSTGLEKAGVLLRQAGVRDGKILLISDAPVGREDMQKARMLRREGMEISVLGVGTADGAPIPQREGGFLTDTDGKVVVPRLEEGPLRELAQAGGGRFALMTADDRDIDALVPPQAAGAVLGANDKAKAHRADVWRDEGRWLVLLLLPLVALGFRRGWLCLWLACLLVPVAPLRAQSAPQNGGSPANAAPAAAVPGAARANAGGAAGEARPPAWKQAWHSLWQRPDQRGAQALEAHQPAQAAELFEDPRWRAAAQYRAGEYPESAASLRGVETADSHYNRGNALARAGNLQAAVAAYDRALELDPGNADATYNRDLVKRLLDQQKKQQQKKGKQGNEGAHKQDQPQGGQRRNGGQSQQHNGADDGEQQARDAQSSKDGQGTSGRRSGSDDENASSADSSTAGDKQHGDAAKTPTDQKSEDDPGDRERRAATPEDVEKWASEQAAEQWLRRVPQDPGGLLRRKFLYQYQRLGLDQDGNYVWPGDKKKPW